MFDTRYPIYLAISSALFDRLHHDKRNISKDDLETLLFTTSMGKAEQEARKHHHPYHNDEKLRSRGVVAKLNTQALVKKHKLDIVDGIVKFAVEEVIEMVEFITGHYELSDEVVPHGFDLYAGQ